MSDAFVAFFSGMMCGFILGIFTFSVILAIRMNEERRENDNERL